MLISYTNLIPRGVFIKDIIAEGRKELENECDYHNELRSQSRFFELVAKDREMPGLGFRVPRVAPHLSAKNVLVSEFAFGYTIDKCTDLPAEVRDRIARGVLRLTLMEVSEATTRRKVGLSRASPRAHKLTPSLRAHQLFVWRFMQTDPNWGNFIYDPTTETVSLIDFGGARDFDKDFVDGYREIVWAAANGEEEALMSKSVVSRMRTRTKTTYRVPL